MAGDLGRDIARDATGIEHVGAALGDLAQRPGQRRVLQHMTDRPRLAMPVVEISRGHRVLAQVGLAGQHLVHARADREALLRQPDRRLE